MIHNRTWNQQLLFQPFSRQHQLYYSGRTVCKSRWKTIASEEEERWKRRIFSKKISNSFFLLGIRLAFLPPFECVKTSLFHNLYSFFCAESRFWVVFLVFLHKHLWNAFLNFLNVVRYKLSFQQIFSALILMRFFSCHSDSIKESRSHRVMRKKDKQNYIKYKLRRKFSNFSSIWMWI